MAARREESPRPYVARAELVLAEDTVLPLRDVPLNPDPLQGFAAAFADVRPDLGERAEVLLDLLPLTPRRRQHLARARTRAAAEEDQPGSGGVLGGTIGTLREMWDGTPATPPPRAAAAARGRGRNLPGGSAGPGGRTRLDPVLGKLAEHGPIFAVQLLVRVESQIPGRAQAILHRIIGATEAWSGSNRWRVYGWNLRWRHIGSDSWLLRRRFDRRADTGLFRPGRESLVTAREIAGLLKPPTKWCALPNVARSGGMVPPAPRELPTYSLDATGVVPLGGWVLAADGTERLGGMYRDDLLFSGSFGKSGYGKTESALIKAIALARAKDRQAVWFLDPHADGWRRAQPYLTDDYILERLWEVDLTVRGDSAMVPGYNPLSMVGLSREHIEDRVDAVVTAIAAALSWGDSANRAKTILTKAVETLCELALILPPAYQPTIFQIRTLLTDDDWREEIVPHLPPGLRNYWEVVFGRYDQSALPVVTNLIDRIGASRTASAFLGQPRSTYDVRQAMDTGKVVFVATPGSGELNRVLTSLLVYDLFRAGRSRIDLPENRRRRCDAFIDELAAVDGATKGYVAAVFEQLRKYQVFLNVMNQMPQRLSRATLDALMQNQSLLSTTAAERDAAKFVTRQWGAYVEPQTVIDLPRFHHIMSTTIAGQRTTPFKVRGIEVTELFEPCCQPDRVPLITDAANRNLGRRRIGDVLAELDELDSAILEQLAAGGGRPGGGQTSPARPPAGGRATGRAVQVDDPDPATGPDEPQNRSGNDRPDNVVPLRRPASRDDYSIE